MPYRSRERPRDLTLLVADVKNTETNGPAPESNRGLDELGGLRGGRGRAESLAAGRSALALSGALSRWARDSERD